MKRVAQICSCLALAGTLLPAILFFADQIQQSTAQSYMLVAALVWFAATPFWMEHKTSD